MEIRYIDFGIAYAHGNLKNGVVELNRELLNHKELMKLVLEHEKEHLQKPSFWQTVIIDIKDSFNLKKQKLLNNLPFKMKLQSNIPVWYDKANGICINMFQICFYLFFIIIGIITLMVA